MLSYTCWRRELFFRNVFVCVSLFQIRHAASMATPSYYSAGRVTPLRMPAHPSQQQQEQPAPQDICRMSAMCSCGSSSVDFLYRRPAEPGHDPSIIDCHCSSCRRFHVSAFVRYLDVPENDVMVSGDSIVRFKDFCSGVGSVQRTYCRICSSKLLTTSELSPGKTKSLVNMGSISDDTIPDDVAWSWKNTRPVPWALNMAASWANALPEWNEDQQHWPEKAITITVTGGCTCGACQYEFSYSAPSEMQHCYCSLCRRLSGGPFMTWVPVMTHYQNFKWLRDASITKTNTVAQRASLPDRPMQPKRSGGEVPMMRYTQIGERHMCSNCAGVLSIQYDFEDTGDEDAMIWLAAGGFDSIRFPFKIEPYLERVVHISCAFKPEWYALPDDGLPRIEDAS